MQTIDRIRRMTFREVAFRLAENARFARERFDSARGLEPRRMRSFPDRALLPVTLAESFRDPEATRQIWMRNYPDSSKRAIAIADGILRHRVPLFSDIVEFDGPIDWHLEYRSRRRAPLDFYRDLRGARADAIGDVKNIWELNRHNFLIHLGKAYFATRDPAYYAKWRELILSWIDKNPYNRGINWESSIELGIRSVNWIWSSYFFSDRLREDRELQEELCRSLYLHADHIYHHLSHYFSPNTHLTAEALSLAYVGMAFPWMGDARRWADRGLDILERELHKQVLGDGCYFEMATYYHKYTIDFYIHYILLRDRDGALPKSIVEKMRKLIRFLAFLAEPDGTIPLIGDSDGGELLAIGDDKRDIRGACCAASVLLEDREIASLYDGDFKEEALWMLGASAREQYARLRQESMRGAGHSLNAESGFYCFRTGMSRKDSFILIDCGPHGWGSCGHAHSDMLSYEWYCGGTKVVVDPGTYAYGGSRELRDELRGSSRHNTITLGGRSQSVPGGAFRWKTVARPVGAFARSFGVFGFFEGGHDGYDVLECRHKRLLLFLGEGLVVVADIITASRQVESLVSAVQCGPGALEEIGDRHFRFVCAGETSAASLRFLGTRSFSCSVREGIICPDYNKAISAPRIELVEDDVEGEQILFSLLGRDADLLASFSTQGENSITGGSAGSEYDISIVRPSEQSLDSAPGEFGVACRAADNAQEFLLLRNARVVRGPGGRVVFESAIDLAFCAAVVRGGTLSMMIDGEFDSFFAPMTIDTLILNGEKRPFVQENGWIRVSAR